MNARYKAPAALSLLVLLVFFAAFSSSAGAVDGGDPSSNKCCIPPRALPPGLGGCPAPPCKPLANCFPFVDEGSWVDGGCQALANHNCLDSIGSFPKPRYVCEPITCELVEGYFGLTCAWYLQDFGGQLQHQVHGCNGDDCP